MAPALHTTGTVTSLPEGLQSFDYIIVGGGTAGCVIADRLSSYLPEARVLVIEAGPSDYQDDRVLLLKVRFGRRSHVNQVY